MENSFKEIQVEYITFIGMCLLITGISPAIVSADVIGASMLFVVLMGARLVVLLRRIPVAVS